MQYKTSRKEALAAGDTKYIGAPCKYGHKGLRYTANSTCIICHKIAKKQYQKKYPEKQYARKKRYRDRYPEKHREIRRKESQLYRERNPEKIKANKGKRRADKINRTPNWLTKEDFKTIQNIYAKAIKKAEETGVKYHVDHIIPLRGKLVSGLHVPSNLQVISAKENLIKHNTYICE